MKLIKILSDKVQIRTDQQEFSNVRINDLISITDGTAELVTMVTAVTDNDAEAGISDDDFILGGASIKVVECSIIGSVHNGRFSKALDQYPTTDITAREIDGEEFSKMISRPDSGFCIGKYAVYHCPAEAFLHCWKYRFWKIGDSDQDSRGDKQATGGEYYNV